MVKNLGQSDFKLTKINTSNIRLDLDITKLKTTGILRITDNSYEEKKSVLVDLINQIL